MARWLDVPGYEGRYQVSDDGQVRGPRGWVIGGWMTGNGYRGAALDRRKYKIGYLVLLAFVGDRPKGLDICHNDGNKLNDRLENLRYDTHRNNMADCVRHGTRIAINEDIVREIRRLRDAGGTQRGIAAKLGIGRNTVGHVFTGYRWGYVE